MYVCMYMRPSRKESKPQAFLFTLRDRHFLAAMKRAKYRGYTEASVSSSKTYFLVTLTIFSMFMLMCIDPGDTMSKISCCVKPSYYYLKIANLMLA